MSNRDIAIDLIQKLDRCLAWLDAEPDRAEIVELLQKIIRGQELDLLRSQTLDELNGSLKQPGFIGSYVASKYSFGEHPAGGTPQSLAGITTADVVNFKRQNYWPNDSVLIFVGDITSARADALASRVFGGWKMGTRRARGSGPSIPTDRYFRTWRPAR